MNLTTTRSTELLPPINAETVLALWARLPESEDWDTPTRIYRCVDRQNVVMIGGSDGETFAVVDMLTERVLTEDELPNEAGFNWETVWDIAPGKQRRKTRKERQATTAAEVERTAAGFGINQPLPR